MPSIKKYLEKHGLDTRDAVKAMLCLKGLTYVTWCATLATCYRFQPLRRLARTSTAQRAIHHVQQRFPGAVERSQRFVDKSAHKLAEWKYFKPIPRALGLKAQHFSLALAENFVLYHVVF